MLFADVVRSMDLAAAVGAERLHEIMTDLFNWSSGVVKRYSGTVDKFTGDGIMAVFGAPAALEDHALRACLAALEIQQKVGQLAIEVKDRDGLSLQLRVGLNSGEVIAGEIGSGPGGYTSVGEQVGMAQRMESVAPPGGVMLSESTARLVAHTAVLGDAESVLIKGSESPVVARRLLATANDGGRSRRQLATLMGREWELNTIAGLLDQSIDGNGRVVGLVGSPGIGKSRMIGEVTALAAENGVEVVTTYCESHTKDVPFHVGARLLRNLFAISNLAPDAARAKVRRVMQDAESEDLLLLEDLLGLRAPDTPPPEIDPDARRRRLAAMLNSAAVARTTPAVFAVEDVHWIDEVSETLIAELSAVVPQTRSLMIVTYRPEYRGALDRLPSSHRIALAPLSESDSTALTAELLGSDPSVAMLAAKVTDRAAGNPFFVEEIIRDLAERDDIHGIPGGYVCEKDSADVRVPASLRAAIAARVDRLEASAKQALNAAAVIGLRFDIGLLRSLLDTVDVGDLIDAELIDQVTFTSCPEYAFRHPLIRAVAYESQLKSDRFGLHRRLAEVIEQRDPASPDENAALIAEHLEAAGDLSAAYDWHMRAAELLDPRDARAARTSWQRARQVADRLPPDDPDQMSRRIAPRVRLCSSAWRIWGDLSDAAFDELDELCTKTGDVVSKAIGLSGLLVVLVFRDRFADAALAASDLERLVESIGDPSLLALLGGAANGKLQGGDARDGLRMCEILVEMSEEELTKDYFGIGSLHAVSLAMRASCRYVLGIPGWRDEFDEAISMAHAIDPTAYAASVMFKYVFAVQNGALLPDAAAHRATAEALALAGQASDDFAFEAAQLTRGLVLARSGAPQSAEGYELLNEVRKAKLRRQPSVKAVRFVDTEFAREKARLGDLDGAVELARASTDFLVDAGDMTSLGPAFTVLVESLLQRGTHSDLSEASAAIDRLAAVPTDPGFVLHELPLLRLRALLARAHGDEAGYRGFADKYRTMANDLGFEGHTAIAAAM